MCTLVQLELLKWPSEGGSIKRSVHVRNSPPEPVTMGHSTVKLSTCDSKGGPQNEGLFSWSSPVCPL